MTTPIALADKNTQNTSNIFMDKNGRDLINVGTIFAEKLQIHSQGSTSNISVIDKKFIDDMRIDNMTTKEYLRKLDMYLAMSPMLLSRCVFYPTYVTPLSINNGIIEFYIHMNPYKYILDGQIYNGDKIPEFKKSNTEHIHYDNIIMVRPPPPTSDKIKIKKADSTGLSDSNINENSACICFRRGYRYILTGHIKSTNKSNFHVDLYHKNKPAVIYNEDDDIIIHTIKNTKTQEGYNDIVIEFTVKKIYPEERVTKIREYYEKLLMTEKNITKSEADNLIDHILEKTNIDREYDELDLDYTSDIKIVSIIHNSNLSTDNKNIINDTPLSTTDSITTVKPDDKDETNNSSINKIKPEGVPMENYAIPDDVNDKNVLADINNKDNTRVRRSDVSTETTVLDPLSYISVDIYPAFTF